MKNIITVLYASLFLWSQAIGDPLISSQKLDDDSSVSGGPSAHHPGSCTDISDPSSPQTIYLTPGESITLLCKGRPSTGYAWYLQNIDDIPLDRIKISGGERTTFTPKGAKQMAAYRLGNCPTNSSSQPKMLGGTTTSCVQLTAKAHSADKRPITLYFVYKQPWQPENGEERKITVIIGASSSSSSHELPPK